MIKKIVISSFNNIAAILQNNKIQEIIVVNNAYQVNDIYIGIVHKIFSSINAAFIKLRKNGKSGFIHISDIKTLKKGRQIKYITEALSINQIILVQIIKEPTINKGPRLTTNIHLYGRYTVLMPFCNTIYISPKIQNKYHRIHLNSLAILLKPATMGMIIRSNAQGVSEKAILEDLKNLQKQWYFIEKIAISTHIPSLIHKEDDLIKKIIRDSYRHNIAKIIIDSDNGLKKIKYYLKNWQCIKPINKIKLQLYNRPEYLLDKFKISDTILESLKPRVKLPLGGYIFIEQNEALTVIDVNSGSFNKSDNSKETILKTNFYAAIEIAYQLKIRNINGLIIVDFIDMLSQKDQLQLLEHFSQLLKLDDSRPEIIQLSELGLVELTRRRKEQSLMELINSKSHKYINLDKNLSLQYNYNYQNKKYENQFLLNKNIKSLFFRKKFSKKISINEKKFYSNQIIHRKYFLNLDPINTIHFIDPKKNYIVPLLFYSQNI
uniref:Ribonuclease E n=1 Tax=Leiomenia cribrosa TaxID=217483 RepID=A0A4D6WW33_9FLOR|nr:ribonuclease E [Leiomenia cribrosa]